MTVAIVAITAVLGLVLALVLAITAAKVPKYSPDPAAVVITGRWAL